MPIDPITIASATESDLPDILRFVRGLAEYEKLAHHLVADEVSFRRTLFGTRPYAEVLIARLDGAPVGYALFFHSYSSFQAAPGIYLEDLFVLPEHRGAGVGTALLKRLAQIAGERNCQRLEWSVLDWNESAIGFYKRIGAEVLSDWRICRMSPAQFQALAGSASNDQGKEGKE